jgi:hypothetical protein
MRLAVEIGWKVAGNTIWRPTRALAEPWGIQLSQPTSFDEAFDQFWERVADKYDIIIKRDRAFLTWRFCNTSFRTYEILAAKVGGELVGYAVLRSTEIEGVATGLITDLLVEQSDRGEAAGLLLAQQATTRFEEAGMSLAGCLMLPHTHEFAILRQSGFVKAPERFSPQTFQLNAKSLSPELSQESLAQSSRWFVTMANHDAV